MTDDLIELFERDLEKLIYELKFFTHDAVLSKQASGFRKAAENLALKIILKLNHYICATLSGSSYERNRAAELESREDAISSFDLIAQVSQTKTALTTTLTKLSLTQLDQDYPEEIQGLTLKTRYFLLHLYGTLSYHLGQINHLRHMFHG